MSHITKIKRTDKYTLPFLKAMCQRLDWAFVEGQTQFRSYTTGFCQHVIRVPGCTYEIGVVVDSVGQCDLAWDPYAVGGLSAVIGLEGQLLNREYDYTKATTTADESRLRWYDVDEERKDWRKIRVEL